MKKYGLIGTILSHSFSEKYFENKFQKENILDCQYKNYSLPSLDFFLEFFKNENLNGINVTIPYKELVLPFLDELSKQAEEIGAVNCIKLENKKLIGHNTDYFGFKVSLQDLIDQEKPKALVLGSGGASKAIQYALKELDIPFEIASRKGTLKYSDINNEIIKERKLIINTTPLGTHPNTQEYPSIPYDALNENHILYDLIYNPEVTTFLNKGLQHKTRIKNGKEMLHLQAEKSWEIWNS